MEKICRETIGTGVVALEPEDIAKGLQEAGTAEIVFIESTDMQKSISKVKPIIGVSSAFINIVGPVNTDMPKINGIISGLAKKMPKDAKIMWGIRLEKKAKGCRVVLIACKKKGDK